MTRNAEKLWTAARTKRPAHLAAARVVGYIGSRMDLHPSLAVRAARPRAFALTTVALGLAAIVPACSKGAPPAAQVSPIGADRAPVHVTTVVAAGRDLPRTLDLSGTLVPDQQSEVTPLVNGRVTEVMIERGSKVHQGDALMRLRDVDFRSAAAAATASLEQARARIGVDANSHERFDPENTAEVRTARANRDLADDGLRRAQQLAQSGSISDQDLSRAQSQAAAAREQYSSAVNNARASYFMYQNARVAVAQNRRNVSDSIVRAPFDGEIAERRANVGEYVTTQRAIVTLVRVDPLRLEVQIPQEKIPFVHEGQGVDLHIDAFPDRVFHGTIRYISAALNQETRSLVAEAVVPNPGGTLRPGLFVTASVQLEGTQTVTVIPPEAVLSEAGVFRAFVIENGHASERVITIVSRTAHEVLVGQGLHAGDRVATSGLERLSDSVPVQSP